MSFFCLPGAFCAALTRRHHRATIRSTNSGDSYIEAPLLDSDAAPSVAGAGTMNSAMLSKAADMSKLVNINYEQLLPGEILGRGYFGEVRRAEWQGTPVACKIIYRESFLAEGQLQLFLREAALLSQLKHPHIVQYLGVAWNPSVDSAVLVTELMEGSSLFARVHKSRYTPSLDFARTVTLQVARGLVYLHSIELIHRDLSSNNILLDANDVRSRRTRAPWRQVSLRYSAAKSPTLACRLPSPRLARAPPAR